MKNEEVRKAKIKDLVEGEAGYKKLSTFGRFCVDSKDCVFKSKQGRELDKWEVYSRGFKNLDDILAGKTEISGKQLGHSVMRSKSA